MAKASETESKTSEDSAGNVETTKTEKTVETKAKPDRPGKFADEVVDGFRWDKSSNDWKDHRGIDHTVDSSEIAAVGMVANGDGSAEKPHSIESRQRW